jgi:hypothetical protein
MAEYKTYNHLQHNKTGSGEDVITFPYTRYENVLGAPKLVTDIESFPGAPFFLYQTDSVDVDETLLKNMLKQANLTS